MPISQSEILARLNEDRRLKLMYWWIITAVCICGALMIQYLCSSKILRMKQAVSIKNMALRDVRAEGSRLDDQEKDLKTQQQSLAHGIKRLRTDQGAYAAAERKRAGYRIRTFH